MVPSIFLELVVAMDQNFLTVLRSQKCPKWVLKPPNLLPIELVSARAPKGDFIPKMRKMGSLTYPP